MSIYLKKIELTGFRGALLPVEIEVAKDKGCVVLYGENGCGKTTFTEAIEWYYYDKIEYLEKEFCKKESYFNTNLADNQGAEVLLNYSLGEYNSLKILPRKSPSYHVNTKPEFKQYIERSRRENFILRHHNLKEFVDDKSKKEKLEHFAKLIGLEKITEIREILLQSYNTIKDSKNFAKLKGQLDEVRKNLKDNFEIEIYDLQNIILYTNRKIKTIYPNKTIKSLDDIKTVQEDLEIAGKSSELQTKIQQLSSIKDNLIKYKNIIVVLRNISEWINGYHSFVSESGIIQQNSLLRLYKIGKSLLSSKEWEDKETCPLCGSKIDGTQLIKHLREEIEKLDSLSKDKATQEENLKKQLNSLTIETNNLKILRGIINDNINQNKFIETESKELIAKIDSFESDILTIAPSLEQSFEALTNPVINIIQIIGKAEDINNLTTRISSLINNEIITLGQSPNSINYLEIASQLKSLTTLFKRLQDLESEIEKYVISYTSIKRILDKFEEEEKSIFEKVIDSISSDIDLYYNILNPDEGIKEISLFPTDDIGAERGIEITYEFHGMKQFPARKYLSESHRNALGLSIFLASGRYFNHINKFLILDDIYTSLDINHRERLITLFTHPSLADLQFFITTHDIIWFKTMQELCNLRQDGNSKKSGSGKLIRV